MSNSLVRAFFLGRAVAEGLGEELERVLADALAHAGKFDAEQREKWRDFTERVVMRADLATNHTVQERGTVATPSKADLQAIVDNLRAEIAQLRTELQRYRSRSST